MSAVFLLLLSCLGCFGQAFSFADPTVASWVGSPSSATYYPSFDYLSWPHESNAFVVSTIGSETMAFGGPQVWDPVSNVFRAFVHDTSGNVIYGYVSTNGEFFQGKTVAVNKGTAGAWDASAVGVPFAWYESGQTRPWRMLYRGSGTSTTLCLGLATSTNGFNWERLDTAGNTLSTWVISNTINSSIDFGNVFKVGSTYYCYWNSIAPPRYICLSTSTDLVNWIRQTSGQAAAGAYIPAGAYFWGATNASGNWDYDDSVHNANGVASSTNREGFFCGWYGRWDRDDGTTEYRAYIPTDTEVANRAKIAVFTSAVPDFNKTNRLYIGDSYNPATARSTFGTTILNIDIPRMYCDDITQNPRTSQYIGSNQCMWLSYGTAYKQVALWRPSGLELPSENPTTAGATFSGVESTVSNGPNRCIHLALNGNANTVLQYQPGMYGHLRDLSGNHLDLTTGLNPTIDSSGVLLTRASSMYLENNPAAHIPQLDTISNTFTLEFSVDKTSVLGASAFGAVMEINGGTGRRTCYCYLNASAEDTNVFWTVQFTDVGGTTRTFNADHFNWTAGERRSFAFVKNNTTMVYYTNGISLSTNSFAFTNKTHTTVDPIVVGSPFNQSVHFWPGHIDELRLSSNPVYTNGNYTISTLPLKYVSSGSIFTRVYAFTNSVTPIITTSGSTPAGCSVSVTHRVASSESDKSVTAGDFASNSNAGQYHQFCITLNGQGTNSPTITSVHVTGQ